MSDSAEDVGDRRTPLHDPMPLNEAEYGSARSSEAIVYAVSELVTGFEAMWQRREQAAYERGRRDGWREAALSSSDLRESRDGQAGSSG